MKIHIFGPPFCYIKRFWSLKLRHNLPLPPDEEKVTEKLGQYLDPVQAVMDEEEQRHREILTAARKKVDQMLADKIDELQTEFNNKVIFGLQHWPMPYTIRNGLLNK